MAMTYAQLREASDEALVESHDRLAKNTVVGTAYFQEELQRRERAAVMAATNRLARRSFWLGVSNTVLAGIAAIAAVVALVQ
jgi:hypothetical protein